MTTTYVPVTHAQKVRALRAIMSREDGPKVGTSRREALKFAAKVPAKAS